MNKIKISSILLLVFAYLSVYSSATYWNNVKQNPKSVYDISSMTSYPTVLLDNRGLKQELLFDYTSSSINVIASMQGEYGRLGVFIEKNQNDLLTNYINNFTGKTVEPVILGVLAAKRMGPVDLGFILSGFSINDYNNDDLSIYDNINAEFSQITAGPSFAVVLPGNMLAEISPQFSLRTAVYEDYITSIQSSGSFGYAVNGRLMQDISGNLFEIFAVYASQAYPYSITESNQTDSYYNRKDSLNIGFIAYFKTFSYVTSYFGMEYSNTSVFDSLTYYNGSDSKQKITETIMPQVNAGIDVNLNRFVYVQFGVCGKWLRHEEQMSPNLNPVLSESGFDWDYVLGLQLNYNSFNVDIGFQKNIIRLPYIISGKMFDDSSIRFGVSYNGFEY